MSKTIITIMIIGIAIVGLVFGIILGKGLSGIFKSDIEENSNEDK